MATAMILHSNSLVYKVCISLIIKINTQPLNKNNDKKLYYIVLLILNMALIQNHSKYFLQFILLIQYKKLLLSHSISADCKQTLKKKILCVIYTVRLKITAVVAR